MSFRHPHHEYFSKAYQTASDIWSHIPYYEDALSLIPKKNGGSLILDIGCGRGDWVLKLLNHNHRVIGIDYVESVINDINKHILEEKLENNAKAIHGNILEMPFAEKSFDILTDIGTFQHMDSEHRKTYVEQIHRVLKSDAYYINVSLSKHTEHFLGFHPADLDEEQFEKFGLSYYFFDKKQIQNIFEKKFYITKQFAKKYISPSDPGEDITLLFTLMKKKTLL